MYIDSILVQKFIHQFRFADDFGGFTRGELGQHRSYGVKASAPFAGYGIGHCCRMWLESCITDVMITAPASSRTSLHVPSSQDFTRRSETSRNNSRNTVRREDTLRYPINDHPRNFSMRSEVYQEHARIRPRPGASEPNARIVALRCPSNILRNYTLGNYTDRYTVAFSAPVK